MIELQRRELARSFVERFNSEIQGSEMASFSSRALEALHVAARNLRPDHFAAVQISALTKRVALGWMIEQINDLLGQCCRIAERHQSAALLRQHLFGMPVRCRNHRLTCTDGVSKS